ncbi:MAG: hypothetical protein JF591_23285 [Lysobacter sp.]|nr:hypothetical protein [Lysobacter sp.]
MRYINRRDPIIESNRRIHLMRCDRDRGNNHRERHENTDRIDPQRGIEHLSPDNTLVRGHRRDRYPMQAL